MRFILILLLLALTFTAPVQAARQIIVNIPEYRLTLLEDNNLLKSYNIAVGTQHEQTPTGTYRILYKEKFPTWFPGSKFEDQTPIPAGPDNPLGTRWLEFHPTFGIHGTNKGWDINYPVSGGCIRMHDKDAQELYEYVDVGTSVTILYETILFEERADGLYVKIWPDIYHRQLNTAEHFASLYATYAVKYPGARVPHFPKLGDYEEKPAEKIAPVGTAAAQPLNTLLPPVPSGSARK